MSYGFNTIDLQDSVHTDLAILFEQMQTCSHSLSDVIIELRDGRHYYAHSWVLTFRSCYFQRMLESQLGESQTRCIRIEDEPYLIEQLLRYLYLGQVKFDNLQQLLCLCITADKYLADRMSIALVEQVRVGWLNQFTAVSIYQFSHHFEQKRLSQLAADYLLANGQLVLANRSLMDLSPEQLLPLIDDDHFRCIENDLLDFLLAYISYYNTEYSGQIQIRTFDSTNIPTPFRIKLDEIGVETINIDPKLTNDVAKECNPLVFKLNRSDQESLLRCIRPQALLQTDNLLKSLSLIYDTRLVSWCRYQLHLANQHYSAVRQCYPIAQRRYRIEQQSGLIKLQSRIFFDSLRIRFSNPLRIWRSLSQRYAVFEYTVNNNLQQQQEWQKIISAKMRLINQNSIEFHLDQIIDACYIRLSMCDLMNQATPVSVELDLIGRP
ncbi:kelch repeat and BTB domain-containing protein 8-like [Dermatophagoides pteronyssinus]|uniref:Uncharacterized protein LOC113789624 n=1 Tax=Dermatophagoides pteronyssinus TaxID=6956 RepID=A0A6P6XNF4_DERPT|nr:uncharacterized protein LOC113789624 [Dermatophagoides pteronyssinus]